MQPQLRIIRPYRFRLFRSSGIIMKRCSVYGGQQFRIFFQLPEHALYINEIMIAQPYFRIQSPFPQIFAHEKNKFRFQLRRKQTRRHFPYLIRFRLVLRRQCKNIDSFATISSKKITIICRILFQKTFAHKSAAHRTARFHSSGRRPRRAEKFQIFVRFQRFAQHGQNVFFILIDRKITFGVLAAVQFGRIIA